MNHACLFPFLKNLANFDMIKVLFPYILDIRGKNTSLGVIYDHILTQTDVLISVTHQSTAKLFNVLAATREDNLEKDTKENYMKSLGFLVWEETYPISSQKMSRRSHENLFGV